MDESVRSIEKYVPASFFLKCLLEDGMVIYLELKFPDIDRREDISHFLTDKSKQVLDMIHSTTRENREDVKDLIRELWDCG